MNLKQRKHQAMIESYIRALIGTGIAAYTASGGNLNATLNALWASLIPVAIRFLDRRDVAFGLGASE